MNLSQSSFAYFFSQFGKFLAAATFVFFASCSSINYHAKAVDKARAKAVRELPMLSDADKFEIKFGKPKIYQRKIFNRSNNPHISKIDVCHTWIVWTLPESDGKCVIVSGVSEARMDDWYPDNVFIRDIDDFEDIIKKEVKE